MPDQRRAGVQPRRTARQPLRRPASPPAITPGIVSASERFQLPTTRSIAASGSRARRSAIAGSTISRSPMRSRRSSRMRLGDAGAPDWTPPLTRRARPAAAADRRPPRGAARAGRQSGARPSMRSFYRHAIDHHPEVAVVTAAQQSAADSTPGWPVSGAPAGARTPPCPTGRRDRHGVGVEAWPDPHRSEHAVDARRLARPRIRAGAKSRPPPAAPLRGRPPSSIQNVTSRLPAGRLGSEMYDTSRDHRYERPLAVSFAWNRRMCRSSSVPTSKRTVRSRRTRRLGGTNMYRL